MQDLSFLDKVIGVAKKADEEANSGSVLSKKQTTLPIGFSNVQL